MNVALKIHDFDDPTYDPYTASERIAGTGAVTDVFPELARLRAIAPVQEIDLRVHFGTMPDLGMLKHRKWSVLGHAEVSEVLRDAGRFSNKIYEPSLGVSFGRPITVMDPPEHRGYRMLFQMAFTPSMIAAWGDTIIPACIGRVLDRIADRGSADLVHDFALHFPFTFIHELLHLPEADRATFQKLAFSQTTVRFDPEHGKEGGEKLRQYLTQLVDQRRANPIEGDFVTTLTQAEVEGDSLPELVLISFLRQLMNAGGDTSYHGFASLIAALLRHPDQYEEVAANPQLVAPAIEEALRWEPPIMQLDRTPTERTELGGVVMEPGDYVGVVIGSANRDGTVFENPDVFDIHRKPARHMAFGYGPHVCIGQHLARLEMTTALKLVIDRLPNLRLDPTQPTPVVRGYTTRKPKEVHALWG